MSDYEIAQLIAAGAALIPCWMSRNLRGAGWVLAISLNLVLSTAVWTNGLPYPAAIVAIIDCLLFVAIFQLGRNVWEKWLFILYQGSMLVSIIRLAMDIWAPGEANHALYSSLLEICNYAAFLVIGSISGIKATSNDFRARLAFTPWRRLAFLVFPAFRDDATDRS
ncbi:MAG: hypothetical protein E6R03_17145 [Hyphomicrobiaceae bacterium]|nr:MAG: hypothetical protein E6R03_17145 [Hyphomicrobiaceae bacterium]